MLSLTATELNRFMACNGFRLLNTVEPFNPSTELADEGNAAHWYIEQVFNGAEPLNMIGQKAPNGVFITDEMVENCSEYLKDIQGVGNVEIDTSYSGNNWEIRGRADHIQSQLKTLIVSDFKYGWKIVEPKMNWTLISHAIGCIEHNNLPVDNVIFRIYQPRPFHPLGTMREWLINADELTTLKTQLINTLVNPSNTVKSGSHCYKCQCLSQCPSSQVAAMNALDVVETAFNSELPDDKLSWMLENLKRAQEILKQSYDAYEDLALHRLKAGKNIKGYSIQAALGQTTWTDTTSPEFIKMLTGVDITTQKLITPAQAKKAGVDENIIKLCTYRPDNGLKLVKVDENKKAEKLFGKKER